MAAPPPSRLRLEGWPAWSVVGALVLCLVGLVLSLLAGPIMKWGLGREGEASTTVRATPSVVVAVRDLARLESAEAHIERVIDVRDRQSHLFGLVAGEDSILLVAVGDVTAGVDLSTLREGDVVVDAAHSTARVTLPHATVLSTLLDNDHTWVYSRNTDVLAQRHEDLETRARQEAERTLEETAVGSGLLDRAQRNAEHTVETLVRSLGYAHVTVTSR